MSVITGLDMFQAFTEAVDCVALWTRTSSQVFGHVSSMYRSSRLRSTLNTNVITGLDMYQSSRLRSTLNTNVITGLDMFQVWPKNSKNKALFLTDLDMCHISDKDKNTAPSGTNAQSGSLAARVAETIWNDVYYAKKQAFTMGSTWSKTRATKDPEGTTRGPFSLLTYSRSTFLRFATVSKNFVDWLIPSHDMRQQGSLLPKYGRGWTLKLNTHPKTNMEPTKWMVKKTNFPLWEFAYFQRPFFEF